MSLAAIMTFFKFKFRLKSVVFVALAIVAAELTGSAVAAQSSNAYVIANRYTETDTNGWNAQRVTFGLNNRIIGHFVQTGKETWEEQQPANNQTFFFKEQYRDDWSVFLYDASRDVRIQLDLHKRRIFISTSSQPNKSEIYRVLKREQPIRSVSKDGLSEIINFENGMILGRLTRARSSQWLLFTGAASTTNPYAVDGNVIFSELELQHPGIHRWKIDKDVRLLDFDEGDEIILDDRLGELRQVIDPGHRPKTWSVVVEKIDQNAGCTAERLNCAVPRLWGWTSDDRKYSARPTACSCWGTNGTWFVSGIYGYDASGAGEYDFPHQSQRRALRIKIADNKYFMLTPIPHDETSYPGSAELYFSRERIDGTTGIEQSFGPGHWAEIERN